MPHTKHIHVRYDDVAVLEIDLDEETDEFEDDEASDPDSDIAYDDVAIPEIHPNKRHHTNV